MYLPENVLFIMDRLRRAGHTAYAVGGCVRDSLLGLEPKDFDITTSAKPAELQSIFSDMRVVETGIAHGTLTVLVENTPYEVTTYRVDGEYTDHRHPDSVDFVDNVHLDLSRRDFTINAMAYSPDTGLVDDFGGQEDLHRGVIRCVGCPETRFREDALRILRGLRFASRLEFEIEEGTANAIHSLAPTLTMVAPERLRVELAKLLEGKGAAEVLREYSDVIFAFLPQLAPMKGFRQNNPHHKWDVWEHTLQVMDAAPRVETMRLAALLHDSGKPLCYTEESDGISTTGHFYGHAEKSREIAEEVLKYLRVDNATFSAVTTLVGCHDLPIPRDKKILRRRLSQLGCDMLRSLIILQHCDRLGTGTVAARESMKILTGTQEALDEVLAEKPCLSVKELAISGKDLLAAGMAPGKQMGECLNRLLEMVLDGTVENTREELMRKAKQGLYE